MKSGSLYLLQLSGPVQAYMVIKKNPGDEGISKCEVQVS